jgi:type IV pilus assembly protein PilA
MKKLFKKDKGFTLVELIVVIAILAILAGVAIPAYSGYISKAHDAADLTQLDSIKTAAVMAATEKALPNSIAVAYIKITASNGTISKVEAGASATSNTDVTTEVTTLTGGTLPKFFETGTYKNGATWDGSKWTAN